MLTSLAGGPKHGYALVKDIEGFAGVRLGPGTLYGCLSKLEAAGLIEALPARGPASPLPGNGRRAPAAQRKSWRGRPASPRWAWAGRRGRRVT